MIHNSDNTEEFISALYNLNSDYEEGKYTKIIKKSEEYLRKYPDKIEVYILISLAYYEKKKFPDSLKILKRAEEKFHSHFDIFYSIANVYYELGDYINAEKYFYKSIEVTPPEFSSSAADCWNDLGVIKSEQGFKDEAIECYKRALEIDPYQEFASDNLQETGKDENDEDKENIEELFHDTSDADFELFESIQQKIYLKGHDRNKFKSKKEEEKVRAHILAAWTNMIAGKIDLAESLTEDQKEEWYNSIEIDFSGEPPELEMPVFDNPLYDEMSNKFSFLPPNGISFLMLAFPFLKAIGISEDDFGDIMNDDEITDEEKGKYIWAYNIGEKVFGLSGSKSEKEFQKRYNEIQDVASERITRKKAEKVLVETINGMIDGKPPM